MLYDETACDFECLLIHAVGDVYWDILDVLIISFVVWWWVDVEDFYHLSPFSYLDLISL